VPQAPAGAPSLVAFDGEPIVGAPVVDIAATGSVPAKIVTCVRCHGHCLSGTRFCKYCGAPLDEAPHPTAIAPRSNGASPVTSPPAHPDPPYPPAAEGEDELDIELPTALDVSDTGDAADREGEGEDDEACAADTVEARWSGSR